MNGTSAAFADVSFALAKSRWRSIRRRTRCYQSDEGERGMAWRSQITEMIRKGICRAFDNVVTLKEDWAQTLPAEYLLTVDIALAISTLNESYGGIGFPFKTYIEAPTKTFIRHCI